MSYGLRLYGQFNNIMNGNVKRVEIHQIDYGGSSSEVTPMTGAPLIERSRGTREDINSHILGREVEFSFWVLADGGDYEFLQTSEYKDLLLLTKTDGITDFVGWIKPENITKGYFDHGSYEMKISAADGLADLKEEPYLNLSEVPYKGTEYLLYMIDHALLRLQYGLAIDDLEFKVFLNTYETSLMASDECALTEIYGRNRRFYKIREGKTEPDSAYTAIEKLLKNFNCKLRQVGGKWYIINRNEPDSYVYDIPRDAGGFVDKTSITRSSVDNVLALSGEFTPWGEVSMLQPLMGVEVKLRNRSLGEAYTGIDEWDAEWTKNNITVESESSDAIKFTMVPGTSNMYMLSDSFSVAKRTDNDYIKITFDYRTNTDIALFKIKNDAGYFNITLINVATGDERTVHGGYMSSGTYNTLETDNVDELKITDDGDYQIRIDFSITSSVTPSEVEMEFDGIPDVTLVSVSDSGGTVADLTFDESITGLRYGDDGYPAGRGIETVETFFGDSGNTSDVAALKDSADNLTENWNRYDKSDGLSLIELYLQNRMNNRQDYAEFVTIDYWDESEEITPEKVISLGSKHYEIIGYTKDHKTSKITLKMVQIWPHTLYSDA